MSDAPDSAIETLTHRAMQLLGEKRPAESVPVFRKLILTLDTQTPDDVEGRGDARRLLGSALRDAGDLDGSNAALNDAIRLLREAPKEAQGFVLAIALRSLARNHDAVGDTAQADAARRESLSLADRLLEVEPDRASDIFFAIAADLRVAGRDGQDVVVALQRRPASLSPAPALGVLLALNRHWRDEGKSDEARNVIDEARQLVRTLGASAVSANFAVVHNLAFRALYAGAIDTTRELVVRLADVARQTQPDEVYAVRRLEALVSLQAAAGQDAVNRARDAYTFARDAFGDEDARTRMSQREVADALRAAGEVDEAIDVYSAVLGVEQRVGDAPLNAASIAWALAGALDQRSRYRASYQMHVYCFQLRTNTLGARHPDTNRSRYEVAELARVLGQVEEAELFYRQALEVDAALHGPETAFGAQVLNNLGETLVEAGRYAAGRTCIERGLAIRAKLSGDDSEDAWRSRMSLAALANRSGDSGRAVALARAAVARNPRSVNGTWLVILSSGLLRQGEYGEAEDVSRLVYERSSEGSVESALSRASYFDVVETLLACRVVREDWTGVVDVAMAASKVLDGQLASIIQRSSEEQLTQFARRAFDLQSLWLWALARLAAPASEQLASAFRLVQLTKGLRTRYLRLRQPGVADVEQIALPDSDASLKTLLTEMRTLQEQLTAALLEHHEDENGLMPLSIVQIEARLRQIERQLAGGIGDFEVLFDEGFSAPENLLRDGMAALEILVVRDMVAERRSGATPAHRYMAFVVGPGTPPPLRLVDLGLCDELDDAIAEMRSSIAAEPWTDEKRPPAWRRLSRFLGARLLTPLWKEISATRHLMIAPDGLLGALPFEILSAPDGEYLLDKTNISYLMRVSELGRFRQLFRRGDPPLVMAGPDFDLPHAFVGARVSPFGRDRLLARALGGSARFQPLTDARTEGLEVAALLGVEAMVGVWALGPELRGQAPEIIHLSTHGFSLPHHDAEVSASLAAELGNALDRRMVLEDPMQRSGLAMSGANARLDGRDIPPEAGTGTIYAAEIQQMNLQRTDMVVLSACRSGLGDVEIGDGAHGLRRAFLAAGARSVVSALWDVPDASSKTLVTRFYQRLLEKTPRLEALADARAAVREAHPHDPVHWAGYVLDGDFGALGRFSGLSELKMVSLSLKDWVAGADDTEGMSRLAGRLTSGADPDPEAVTSAVTLRRAAARTDLTDGDARFFVFERLGGLANRLGDNDTALECFRQMLGMEHLPPEGRARIGYNIAKTLHQIGRVEEAITAYKDLITQTADVEIVTRALNNRGVACVQIDRPLEAIADFTSVIDNPDAPPMQRYMAHLNRADVLSQTDTTAAVRDLEVGMTMAPDHADEVELLRLRIIRVRLWVQSGNVGPALDEIADLERHSELSDEARAMLSQLAGR